jgi:hypothetical protein
MFLVFTYFCRLLCVCEGHACNAHDRCVAAGYDNGDIKLFDLRNMSLRWETNVKNGVSAVQAFDYGVSLNLLQITTISCFTQIQIEKLHSYTIENPVVCPDINCTSA